jgi:hypothetical protein
VKLPQALKIFLSLLVLAAAAWLGTNRICYNTCVGNIFLAFSLGGFALIYLRLNPKLGDAACLLGAGGLLALIDVKAFHYDLSGNALLALVGLAAILALALRGIWSRGDERQRQALAFLFAVFSISANGLAGFFHNWTSKFTPRVVDLYLYCFDASLRVQFAFLMGRAYATWHWFRDAGMFVYVGFPLTIALVFAGQLLRDKKTVLSAMTSFLVTGPLGVIFYAMCPALGPAYLFTSRFPWNPLTKDEASRLVLEALPIPGLRNSMPSLHIAWVLLAWWYSEGLSVLERSIAMGVEVFTGLATLGSGEHYLVDLIVACPFALFIYALCAFHVPWSNRNRVVAAVVGLATTLAWIGLLRFNVKMFWLSPVIPWFACIATIISASILRQQLADVAQRISRSEPSAATVTAASTVSCSD